MTENGSQGYFTRNSRLPANSIFMIMNMRPGTRVTMNKKKTMTLHLKPSTDQIKTIIEEILAMENEPVTEKNHQGVDISTVNDYRYLLKERGEKCKNQKAFWIM